MAGVSSLGAHSYVLDLQNVRIILRTVRRRELPRVLVVVSNDVRAFMFIGTLGSCGMVTQSIIWNSCMKQLR